MTRLLDEIKFDARFIKSHTLQPKWYKILKVFIILGFLVGYLYLFGLMKTLVFFAVFLISSLVVHLVYRNKTNKWKQSWLDFTVEEINGEIKPTSIGKYYYSAVILNAILALVVSQVFH